MVAFTFFAVQFLLWQSADISVSIVSEADEGNSEVTISVLNTAGSTLLFYENTEVSGTIEYLSEDGWVEYCDVSYTASNASAVSQQYGGTFAELEPGESWDVSVPKEKVADMKNGTYRIKMTYITEKNYKKYLNNSFANRFDNESTVISETEGTVSDIMSEIDTSESENSRIEEEFLASSECEVYIETFKFSAPEDYVGTISIDDTDIVKGRAIDEPTIEIVH